MPVNKRDLKSLAPEFQERATYLLELCAQEGFIFKPFSTLRGPRQQASIWCRGRDEDTIQTEIYRLEHLGANYLAKVLKSAPRDNGPRVSNAIPGMSWHQYGEAMDCFLWEDGKANWDGMHPGYEAYAELAEALGLRAGYYFRSRDSVHVQFRRTEVSAHYLYTEVDEIMERTYGGIDE